MKAVLFAAGSGSRLKPLTETWPKCLMPIGNRPLFFLGILLIVVGIQSLSIGLLGELSPALFL